MGQIGLVSKQSTLTASPPPSSSLSILFLLSLCAWPAACGGGSGSPQAVTFYEDVAPILDAQCVGCHRAGGIAPFLLSDYASAKAHAAAIVSATAARLMPPMPVDDSGSCNRYSNARWLTDAEIATLGAWAAHGAPQGDSRKAPGPPAPPASLGAPDAVVDTGVTYVPAGAPGHEQDDYHCFVAPGPVSAAAFLVGFEVVPGDARVVHHVIAYQPADEGAAPRPARSTTGRTAPATPASGARRERGAGRAVGAGNRRRVAPRRDRHSAGGRIDPGSSRSTTTWRGGMFPDHTRGEVATHTGRRPFCGLRAGGGPGPGASRLAAPASR